jgi:hypothetical protein
MLSLTFPYCWIAFCCLNMLHVEPLLSYARICLMYSGFCFLALNRWAFVVTDLLCGFCVVVCYHLLHACISSSCWAWHFKGRLLIVMLLLNMSFWASVVTDRFCGICVVGSCHMLHACISKGHAECWAYSIILLPQHVARKASFITDLLCLLSSCSLSMFKFLFMPSFALLSHWLCCYWMLSPQHVVC